MFRTEQQLVQAFQLLSGSFLRELYGKPVTRHFELREFDSHFGVADIVLGTFRPYLSTRHLRKPVNTNWVAPLFQLQGGSIIQLDTYISQFGVSRSLARQQMQEFTAANFIEPVGNNSFRVIQTYKPVVDHVVSIEAKLNDWKQALSQAMRYRRFSDYAFVLMDEDCCDAAARNLAQFDRANVGLIALDDACDDIHFYHVPEMANKKNDYYFNRLNESAYSYFIKAYASS